MSLAGLRPKSLIFLLLAILLLSAVYGYALGDVGLLGPDEPRYASIGREMARSGDWVTPRLWGEPWFEKPPLLYWLTAAGQRAGLGDDLAPRLPVALLSLCYLVLQFVILVRLNQERTAWIATLMLATTAGWCAYSQVGVTDMPLAATFNACLLLCLLYLETGSKSALVAAGACFGLAVLAKGFVPGVLILPLLWFAREHWRRIWLAALAAVLVAGPWYGAMLYLHGKAFFDDFIVRHHFSRFASDVLQHEQPFWFYLPVLLAGLFPWPAMAALLGKECWGERRHRILTATFVFGLLFFSASTNKLPGYVLPLMPSLCILIGVGADRAARAGRPLALSSLLLALCPVVASILPDSLLLGLRRASAAEVRWEYVVLVVPLVAAVWWFDNARRRLACVGAVAAAAAAGLFYIKMSSEPALDQLVSARGLWRKVEPREGSTCVDSLHRSLRYGLNYYSSAPLPDCEDSARPVRVVQEAGALPRLEPRRD